VRGVKGEEERREDEQRSVAREGGGRAARGRGGGDKGGVGEAGSRTGPESASVEHRAGSAPPLKAGHAAAISDDKAGRSRPAARRASEAAAGGGPRPTPPRSAALAHILITINEQIKMLESQVHANFLQHPDAEIYLSQPGLEPSSAPGARRVRRRRGPLRQRHGQEELRGKPARSPASPQRRNSSWPATWRNDRLIDPSTDRPSPPCAPRQEPRLLRQATRARLGVERH